MGTRTPGSPRRALRLLLTTSRAQAPEINKGRNFAPILVWVADPPTAIENEAYEFPFVVGRVAGRPGSGAKFG